MTGPVIDNRVSLGNVMVGVGMIASVAVAWGNISGRAETMVSEIASQKAAVASNEQRIRSLENATARQDERLTIILGALRKIENKVDLITDREFPR